MMIALIRKHFVFDETNYPELAGRGEGERLAFALRHVAIHCAKTTGKIATVSEAADHGEAVDKEGLEVDCAKALINTLRLADLIGLSGKDLERIIGEVYGEQEGEALTEN